MDRLKIFLVRRIDKGDVILVNGDCVISFFFLAFRVRRYVYDLLLFFFS